MVKSDRNYSLTNARKTLGLTQAQLSSRLGIKPEVYNTYETGSYIPSLDTQVRISNYFVDNGVPVIESDLFPEKERSFEKEKFYDKFFDENLALDFENKDHFDSCLERILTPRAGVKPRQIDILKRFYGIGCNPESVEEIAKTAGKNGQSMSKARVYQMMQSAVNKIRRDVLTDKKKHYLIEF